MDLTARDFERIPRGNLHVRVGEFARLWLAAERRADALKAEGREWDPYLGGVQAACRWIAGAITVHDHPSGPVPQRVCAPITRTREKAYEELVEQETQAAERAVVDGRPGRPGFAEGALVTLVWAWRRSGVPPIDVGRSPQG